MATYPVKMLKDEEGKPFVPLISIDSIKEVGGETLEQQLDKKLETTNIIAGTQIALEVEGNNVIISNSAEGTKLINNLDQTTVGVGALDAAQGKVLKESIPEVINNLTTIDSKKALSAHQGYILAGRSVPVGGGTGQVLMKSADDDYSLTWGDAADPNAIVGDGSIKKIVELTYDEYMALEEAGQLEDTTEYHISDMNEQGGTYITENEIQDMIDDSIRTDDEIEELIEANIVNNLTSTSTTDALSAAQGKVLNEKVEANSRLIARVVAENFTSKLELSGLNLSPGTYEIVVAEFSNKSTGYGHVLRLNGATDGYQGIHMHPDALSTSSAGLTMRIAYHGNCLAYLNGWNMAAQLNYGVYTLHYFNQDWITATGTTYMVPYNYSTTGTPGAEDGTWNTIYQQGSYNGHNTNSITSISIESLDTTTIGTGSYIELYKK